MSGPITIEQALGYVAQRYYLTGDEAFELLRSYGLRLIDVDHQIIRPGPDLLAY